MELRTWEGRSSFQNLSTDSHNDNVKEAFENGKEQK